VLAVWTGREARTKKSSIQKTLDGLDEIVCCGDSVTEHAKPNRPRSFTIDNGIWKEVYATDNIN
jgi:hypothetical protein